MELLLLHIVFTGESHDTDTCNVFMKGQATVLLKIVLLGIIS